MYSVVGTLSMNGIDILSWLDTWLAACVNHRTTCRWLPWSARSAGANCDRRDRVRAATSPPGKWPARADRRAAAVEPPYAVDCRRITRQGHDGQGRHAGHAQGRPDRPAGAAGTAEPARADRLPDTEAPLFPAPTTLDKVRALDAPRRARHPPEQALERARRPLPLSRIQDPGRRPCATRQHDRDGLPCYGLPRGSSPRATTSSDPAEAREEPSLRGRRFDPALDQYRPTWVRTSWPSSMNRALQHHARAHRDLRPDPALHRRRLQGLRLDPRRDHPGARALR